MQTYSVEKNRFEQDFKLHSSNLEKQQSKTILRTHTDIINILKLAPKRSIVFVALVSVLSLFSGKNLKDFELKILRSLSGFSFHFENFMSLAWEYKFCRKHVLNKKEFLEKTFDVFLAPPILRSAKNALTTSARLILEQVLLDHALWLLRKFRWSRDCDGRIHDQKRIGSLLFFPNCLWSGNHDFFS